MAASKNGHGLTIANYIVAVVIAIYPHPKTMAYNQ
jgi:hypothetical protein